MLRCPAGGIIRTTWTFPLFDWWCLHLLVNRQNALCDDNSLWRVRDRHGSDRALSCCRCGDGLYCAGRGGVAHDALANAIGPPTRICPVGLPGTARRATAPMHILLPAATELSDRDPKGSRPFQSCRRPRLWIRRRGASMLAKRRPQSGGDRGQVKRLGACFFWHNMVRRCLPCKSPVCGFFRRGRHEAVVRQAGWLCRRGRHSEHCNHR